MPTVNSLQQHLFCVFIWNVSNHDSCALVLTSQNSIEVDDEMGVRLLDMLRVGSLLRRLLRHGVWRVGRIEGQDHRHVRSEASPSTSERVFHTIRLVLAGCRAGFEALSEFEMLMALERRHYELLIGLW